MKNIKVVKKFTVKEKQKALEKFGFLKSVVVSSGGLTNHLYNKNVVKVLRWEIKKKSSTDTVIDPEISSVRSPPIHINWLQRRVLQ